MASANRTVAETVLTVANNKGESFTVVAYTDGGYGITREGQPVDGHYGEMRKCIDALVVLAGIDFDGR